MLVSIAAIVLTVAGGAGAEAAVSGTDQATATPAPTTSERSQGTATRYVSNPPSNPSDQAYCNLQADRANSMAASDPTSARWIVESANSNGCKIVEA
ncbi:hypothetical protein [Rhodococcus maanshanensis]|uniref:Excalibur calcium-binding domain-containing protein n=1 Tax=Rhodococcus maanshanensis TaxID=183556 RepID=A0A1H7WP73_9NOCA|nr:hypothetical protein [Rhodococcus maanshanensis]SEM23251.1 hypothetical protein SAMN05444583_12812 [Rhodococcus maanshanensis]